MSDKNSVLELTGMNETVPGRSEQRSTRMVFFMAGFATAAWAALVPFAKYNTGVSDGTLGILLLCLGGGALVAMPLTGMLTARFGCRRVMVISVLIFSAILPLLAVTSDARLLALALLLFGIGVGTTDCAMNVQAIIVEKASPRPLMSGFHGFYSVGGIAGAGAMSGMMSLGLSASAASLATTIIVLLLLTLCVRGFLTYANPQEGPAFAVPHGIVLLLGAVCFIVFLAEGAVLDWSAVYLTEYRGLSEARGGLGFACFAATMTLGRLTGDRIVARLGQQRVVFTGALVAATGILLTVWGGSWELALMGYALVGMGCANIVPVMFSAIGRQTAMPQVLAVPAVTTLGYMGVLAGPASIGGIAHHSSLAVAFIVVAIAMLAVAAVSKLIRV